MLHLPKISLDILSPKERGVHLRLNKEAYGEELAKKVAKRLGTAKYRGWGLYHSHRDYCGLGIFLFDQLYTLGVVNDGYGPHPVLVTFEKEKDFVHWLAQENDQSMALYGENFNNQTITRLRLEWFLEESYSPVWNDYCHYLRTRK